MRIAIDNKGLNACGFSDQLGKEIADRLSYLQAGHQHTNAYQNRLWDGRRRLITLNQNGNLHAPIGLAQAVIDIVDECETKYELVNNHISPNYKLGLRDKFDFQRLREYQGEAMNAMLEPRGSLGLIGRGILKMPPRSGKTLTAAAIIAKLDVRTLFIVPSTLLLYQAKEALTHALGEEVGIVGDGEWQVRDVTVATVQTLLSRRGDASKGIRPTREYVQLLREADLIVADECHHMSGDSEWRKVVQDSAAAYKIGLSATVFLDHNRECELGIIWLRAMAGDILFEISTSDLIESGYLVRPEIRLYPIREPDLRKRRWSSTLQREAIFTNEHRNQMIVRKTLELVAEGLGVVIISSRLEQTGAIARHLLATGLPFGRMTGQTSKEARDDLLERFRRGEIKAIVSTVLDEGVDIPEIDAVVIAEGGSDIKATFQRLRCMTPAPGKDKAVVVDFIDLTNPYFADHSMKRLAAYRSERAFKIRLVEK